MTVEVIIKTNKKTGERSLHSAHKSLKAAKEYVRTQWDVIPARDPKKYDYESALFYFEIEETYLFD